MNTTQRSSASARSPIIRRIAWGRMEIEGIGEGKDFKLWPGGGRAWDWNETGTRHVPGIQPADVVELLEHDCEIVVLSRGMWLALQTMPATLVLLESHGVAVQQLETGKAVDCYNEHAERGDAVGGLFHSTC